MEDMDNRGTFRGNYTLHDGLFTKGDFSQNHMKRIEQYLGNQRIVLFYPGTSRDIFTPMRYLKGMIDEFFFNDNDPRVKEEMEDGSFQEHLINNGFKIIEYSTVKENGVDITRYLLEHGTKRIKFNYYHCSWESALSLFLKNEIKISFLYLYGIGYEGGSKFIDAYKCDRRCGSYECTENDRENLQNVLTKRFVAIHEGQVNYRDMDQYNFNWKYQINDINLNLILRDITCQADEEDFDGLIMSQKYYDDWEDFAQNEESEKELIERYRSRTIINTDWPISNSYEYMKKLLETCKQKKWCRVATTEFGDEYEHYILFKAISEWDDKYPKNISIVFEEPYEFLDLQDGSIEYLKD